MKTMKMLKTPKSSIPDTVIDSLWQVSMLIGEARAEDVSLEDMQRYLRLADGHLDNALGDL